MNLHLQTVYLFVNDNILKRNRTKPEKKKCLWSTLMAILCMPVNISNPEWLVKFSVLLSWEGRKPNILLADCLFLLFIYSVTWRPHWASLAQHWVLSKPRALKYPKPLTRTEQWAEEKVKGQNSQNDSRYQLKACGCDSLLRDRESQINFPRTSLGNFRELEINNESQLLKTTCRWCFSEICFPVLIRLLINVSC